MSKDILGNEVTVAYSLRVMDDDPRYLCVIDAEGIPRGWLYSGQYGGITLYSTGYKGDMIATYTSASGKTVDAAARELLRRTDPQACLLHRVTGYGAAAPCADCYGQAGAHS